jgi:hypothetical protein
MAMKLPTLPTQGPMRGVLAFSVNNSGQVVRYYFANSTDHGFVATDPPQATQTIASSSPTDPVSVVERGTVIFGGSKDASGGTTVVDPPVNANSSPGLDHVAALTKIVASDMVELVGVSATSLTAHNIHFV